jgi:hypothetical protein
MDSQKSMMSVKDSLCFIIHSISCNLTQGLYPPHVSVAAPDAEHQQQCGPNQATCVHNGECRLKYATWPRANGVVD